MGNLQNSTSIEINGGDAALILRVDGTFDLSLPEAPAGEVPENIMTCAALAFAVQDADLCKAIFEKFFATCGNDGLQQAAKAANNDLKISF